MAHSLIMRFHASCAARSGPLGTQAVLLCGPSGCGKSDLLLRLMRHGFELVADDQVLVENGIASAPDSLAGILEVRGLGLFRLPFMAQAPLTLIARLGTPTSRLPMPVFDEVLNLPVISIDPAAASAPERLIMALDCAAGRVQNIVGAFTA